MVISTQEKPTHWDRDAICPYPTHKQFGQRRCQSCYALVWRRLKNPNLSDKLVYRDGPLVCGHPDSKYRAKGMCKRCYDKHYRSVVVKVRTLKDQYKMSLVEFNEMLASQGGSCAICKRTVALNVDHRHSTGMVRGLLCNNCNLGLGNFRDDVDLLKTAIKYLENNDKGTYASAI